MRIARKIKSLFCQKLIDELPDKSDTSNFFTNDGINYSLLQKHLIESHLQAFNYYSLLVQLSLEAGCTESLEAAHRGVILHSKEIARISGMAYFAEINAAAARLEREGYSINDKADLS